jgi:beta-galactosidase
MKRIFTFVFLLTGLILCISDVLQAQGSPRSRESFNDGWKFVRYFNASDEAVIADKEPENLQLPSANDNTWRTVDLPHDWAIEGPFSDTLENDTGLLPWKGIGWYRKHFKVDESDKDKRIYVDIDGAMAYAKIWLNGKFVGEWPYGYTSFRLDLTPYVLFGQENIIAIRLDTKSYDSRWYPGAGLYRNVWLVKTSQLHVAYNGLFITTPGIKKESASVSVKTEIENHLYEPSAVSVKASVYKLNEMMKPAEKPVAESVIATAIVMGMKDHTFRLDISVKDPVLWDITDPELYMVAVTVMHGDVVTDRLEANFGFRTLEFTPRDGFLLNGK